MESDSLDTCLNGSHGWERASGVMKAGDKLEENQVILVLEAMKRKSSTRAKFD